MGIGVINALSAEPMCPLFIIKQVIRIIHAVSALAKHRTMVCLADDFRRRHHIRRACNFHIGKHLRLGNVRRNNRRKGQKLFLQRRNCILANQLCTAGRNHHRVNHDIFRMICRQPFRNHGNQVYRRNHPDFHRIGADIRKYAVNLHPQKFRCHLKNPLYAGGILRRQCCNRAHGEYPVHRHGFQIRLNPCAAAGIAACNAQCCFHAVFLQTFSLLSQFFTPAPFPRKGPSMSYILPRYFLRRKSRKPEPHRPHRYPSAPEYSSY